MLDFLLIIETLSWEALILQNYLKAGFLKDI